MVIKLASGEICYVESVSHSSAHISYVSRFEKPITTRKGVTVMVMARKPDGHISRTACVEILDPNLRYVQRIREQNMADEQGQEVAAEAKSTRAQQVYTRTSKKPEKQPTGQAAIVLAAIDQAKAGTIADITALCKGKFTTRQEDSRIVGFYLSQFKRKGLVSTDKPVVSGEVGDEEAEEVAAE